MLQSRLLAFACLLMCFADGVNAAAITKQSAALTPVLPARGAYYDSSKSGTGVFIDVGANGFVFLAYFGYDSLGVPVWHTIQASWAPATEAQRIATGVIGTLDSPLLYATGGQCITCDFTKPPTLVAEPYPVTVSWTTPRHLDLTIGNESWHMDAVQYSVPDAQLLAGTWQLTISWDGNMAGDMGMSNTDVAAGTQIATIAPGVAFGTLPIPTTVALDPAADPGIALPPAGSSYFSIETSAPCQPGPLHVGTYGAAFSDIFSAVKMSSLFSAYPSGNQYLAPMLWYDATTHRGGLDVVTRAMGVDTVPMALGPNNVHFDLFVESDRVVGHGLVQGQNLKNIPGAYWLQGTVALNLVMERLPDGLREHSIYPCLQY